MLFVFELIVKELLLVVLSILSQIVLVEQIDLRIVLISLNRVNMLKIGYYYFHLQLQLLHVLSYKLFP